MGRSTGNRAVVKNLQDALMAFLADQRQSAAENDPQRVKDREAATPEELENDPGCGCEDCIAAGQLLGRI
jgi:hypothetical protein